MIKALGAGKGYVQRRWQAAVGSGAGCLLLSHDNPLADGLSSPGGDCQYDAVVLDVICSQLGGGAAGGGYLFTACQCDETPILP
jgi:hypothetical protein